MTYSEALAKLNGKTRKSTGQRGTSLVFCGSFIAVAYHNTYVVKIFPDGCYQLFNGGWYTSTTKNRINEYCPVAGISQRKGVWYLANGELFVNGITLDPGGSEN